MKEKKPLKEKVYLPPIENKSKPKFVSAKTSAYSVVGLLLVIALVATIVIGYSNSNRNDGVKEYFSVSAYLHNLSSDSILIHEGQYIVDFPVEWGLDDLLGSYVHGYVTIGDVKIKSINGLSQIDSMRHAPVDFRINQTTYTAEWQYIESLGRNAYALNLPNIYYTIDSMPDPYYLTEKWRDVNVNNFFECVQETFVFIGDFVSYTGNTLLKLMPWNTVVTADETTPNLEQIWSNAESSVYRGE